MLPPVFLQWGFSCLARQKVFICSYHSRMFSLHYFKKKKKSQKSNFFPWKKKSRNARFLAVIPCDASSCLRLWHGLAGAEVKAEEGKADPVGCRVH